MSIRKALYLIVLLAPGCAQTYGAGGAAGAYLRPPAGAAMAATGGAGIASAGYACSWYNPALLTDVSRRQVTLGTGLRSQGRLEGLAAWELRIPPRMSGGVTVLYRGDPRIKNLYDEDENPVSSASFTTLTLKTGLGWRSTPRLSLGANVSIFYQQMPTTIDEGTPRYSTLTDIGGFDAGMLYRINNRLRGALTVRNIATVLGWEIRSDRYQLYTTVSDTLPVVAAAGVSFAGRDTVCPWELSVDAEGYPFSAGFRGSETPFVLIHAGGQWKRWKELVLRAGLRNIFLSPSLVEETGAWREEFRPAFCAGFGWRGAALRRDYIINYACTVRSTWTGIDQQIDVVYEL